MTAKVYNFPWHYNHFWTRLYPDSDEIQVLSFLHHCNNCLYSSMINLHTRITNYALTRPTLLMQLSPTTSSPTFALASKSPGVSGVSPNKSGVSPPRRAKSTRQILSSVPLVACANPAGQNLRVQDTLEGSRFTRLDGPNLWI